MKTATALALLALTQPAEAGCHKFSIWNYPYPQRCPVPVRTVAASRIINDGVYYPPPKPPELEAEELLRERLAHPPGIEPDDLLLSLARELHL